MFYLVPLGNPGEKYEKTRHNVGWQALNYCRKDWRLPELVESGGLSGRLTEGVVEGQVVTVLYPNTFMNNSGSAVVKLVPQKEVTNLIVIHDDVDLPLGEIKIVKNKGAGGNNGVESIIKKMGTKDFIRVRIGVAPKSFWSGKTKRPTGGGPLEKFVLKPFTRAEQEKLVDVYKQVEERLESIIKDGVAQTMNSFN